jgi:DNA-directed RNA polymerase III subunit RPC5
MNRVTREIQWLTRRPTGNLHLTPAQSEIQLRPQLHHLDAATEQDRLARPGQGGTGGGGGGGPGGPGGGGPPAGPAAAPKAITMTIKSSGGGNGGDQTTTETMADRLRHVQTEPWQKLRYVDENDADAWDLYHQTLVYQAATENQDDADAKDAKDKGKAKETKPDEEKGELLDAHATHLRTHWDEEDLLHAVAGKDRQGVLEGYGNAALPPGVKPGDAEVKKEGGLGGRAATTAAAKGKAKAAPVRAKAPASRENAMEID